MNFVNISNEIEFPLLETLDISKTRITDETIKVFCTRSIDEDFMLCRLQKLWISSTKITSKSLLIEDLSKWNSLVYLNLHCTDVNPSAIERLKRNLSNNKNNESVKSTLKNEIIIKKKKEIELTAAPKSNNEYWDVETISNYLKNPPNPSKVYSKELDKIFEDFQTPSFPKRALPSPHSGNIEILGSAPSIRTNNNNGKERIPLSPIHLNMSPASVRNEPSRKKRRKSSNPYDFDDIERFQTVQKTPIISKGQKFEEEQMKLRLEETFQMVKKHVSEKSVLRGEKEIEEPIIPAETLDFVNQTTQESEEESSDEETEELTKDLINPKVSQSLSPSKGVQDTINNEELTTLSDGEDGKKNSLTQNSFANDKFYQLVVLLKEIPLTPTKRSSSQVEIARKSSLQIPIRQNSLSQPPLLSPKLHPKTAKAFSHHPITTPSNSSSKSQVKSTQASCRKNLFATFNEEVLIQPKKSSQELLRESLLLKPKSIVRTPKCFDLRTGELIELKRSISSTLQRKSVKSIGKRSQSSTLPHFR
eukprot:TRINITY_DN2353_c0_g2_i3.p1 TRINITY_DN2353_c0_g2~~TRINITY_DN2353_c0_g2_i3.p1  ORF type:complete len:533 (-),score=99.30 TRINITY_DN2353_c0_g2_i3:989-2587(-)